MTVFNWQRTCIVVGFVLLALMWSREHPTAAAHYPPIRKDIKEAIALGVSALNNSFDKEKDGEPFFYANRRADGTGEFRHSINIGIPHVVGRCLWASMLAEETAGIQFPEEGLRILTRYCKTSFDNKDHLNSYFDPKKGNQRMIEFHNMREGLFGLVALMRGRHSQWARETAHLMLVTLDQITSPEGHFSIELAQKAGIAAYAHGIGHDATTNGRLIDPLIEYYRFTKDPLALKLAGVYASATLDSTYTLAGKFAPMKTSGGHIHSITSSLSGITLYAASTGNAQMLEKCRLIVDNGVPEYFSSWGWGDEVTAEHPANVQSRGEINQTGDVIRTALLLGQYVSPKYYELAERYIRGMLLPAQLREDDLRKFLRENSSPKGDLERDVLRRSIGGYGFPLPNDRMREGDWPLFTLDITSGGVHALCEAWRHRVTSDDHAIKVNLLFDYEGSELIVRSGLPAFGRLDVESKTSKSILVRIPEWVSQKLIKLTLDRKQQEVSINEGYMKLAVRPGTLATISFAMPERQADETVDGMLYHTKWIGNQIVEIQPRGKVSPLPF